MAPIESFLDDLWKPCDQKYYKLCSAPFQMDGFQMREELPSLVPSHLEIHLNPFDVIWSLLKGYKNAAKLYLFFLQCLESANT